MKKRKVYVTVAHLPGRPMYRRSVSTIYTGEADYITVFEFESEETIEKLNKLWYADVLTRHPQEIDWTKPVMPKLTGFVERGQEELDVRDDQQRRQG